DQVGLEGKNAEEEVVVGGGSRVWTIEPGSVGGRKGNGKMSRPQALQPLQAGQATLQATPQLGRAAGGGPGGGPRRQRLIPRRQHGGDLVVGRQAFIDVHGGSSPSCTRSRPRAQSSRAASGERCNSRPISSKESCSSWRGVIPRR